MPTNTLTSLAILRVNIDQGRDYLDYLLPFVVQVLIDQNLDPITSDSVSRCIREQFGLEIPSSVVEVILNRLAKQKAIQKDLGIYHMTSDLPDPQITARQARANRHIGAVLNGLRQFSQDTANPVNNDDEAIESICTFLAEFDIICLRAYLRGTTIPNLGEKRRSTIVLVSEYVQHLQQSDPERFESFLILVQGHMLANALTCPDLHNAPKSYEDVTFYLDTPILVRMLGAEGEYKQVAASELISLLNKLGGNVAAFSHSRQELQNVLQGAANFLETSEGRGEIIFEARRRGTTRSDLLLLSESIDDKLQEAGIQVEATPRYMEEFQIDEKVFEEVLEDGLWYFNPRAREFDINSVRSVYVLRGNSPVTSIERARAVLVTSNSAFARAAWEYGREYESSQTVSSVITDFSLANMAWLKAPLGAPNIPTTQLLSFSYAALEPSEYLLTKYLAEVDRLEGLGKISERDHQLLRSSPSAYSELMHLTLGEDAALTEETITQTLQRMSSEIKQEETAKLSQEQRDHQDTLDALRNHQAQNREIVRKLYWRCHDRARVLAWIPSLLLVLLLVAGALAGLGLGPGTPIPDIALLWGSLGLALMTLLNLAFGSTLRGMHEWMENRVRTWLLNLESKSIGTELNELDTDR